MCKFKPFDTQAQRSDVNFFGDYYIEFDMYFFSYEFHYFVAKAKLNFLSTNPIYKYALGPVYTGTDPNGSVPIRVQIGFPFTLEPLDPYRCGSAIRTKLGSLSKVYPFGSVPVEV